VVIAVNPAESFHGASMKMKHILEPSLLPSTHAKHIHYLQGFELSPGEKWEEPGSERQQLTLVLSSADGCKVTLA